MFKKLFLIVLLAISGLNSSLAYADQALCQDDEHIMPTSDDRWVPWPFHLARPFPWKDIQGLWKVESGEFTSFFALKVVNTRLGVRERQLQVKQFDGETCRIIATGVGLERNQKIFAQMTSRGGVTYRVHLTAFDKKDSPIPPKSSLMHMDDVMVLSMGALDAFQSESMFHMQIMKVSTNLTQRDCLSEIRKMDY